MFASQIVVKGAAYRDGILQVSEGDQVTADMVASDETGDLKGFVWKGGKAVEAVPAVLVRQVEPGMPPSYRGFQTESDGSFDFRLLPAGKNFLFAVDDTAFEYANDKIVQPM